MGARVLFFGATADVAGRRLLELETSGNATVASVLAKLVEDHPALRNFRLKVAVNQSYVSADTAIRDGDELAVFTAVSGG